MLSHGDKEILLKSVALAMPIYAMSYFKFHVATMTNLTSVMADFLWDKRKIYRTREALYE